MVQVFMMKAGLQFSLALVMLFSSFLACATTSLQQAIDAINRQDYSSAYNQLLPLARQGDREAQYYLGSMLVEGKGVKADPEKGVSWLEKSVDNKYHLAAQTLGYYEGTQSHDLQGLLRNHEVLSEKIKVASESPHVVTTTAQENAANDAIKDTPLYVARDRVMNPGDQGDDPSIQRAVRGG